MCNSNAGRPFASSPEGMERCHGEVPQAQSRLVSNGHHRRAVADPDGVDVGGGCVSVCNGAVSGRYRRGGSRRRRPSRRGLSEAAAVAPGQRAGVRRADGVDVRQERVRGDPARPAGDLVRADAADSDPHRLDGWRRADHQPGSASQLCLALSSRSRPTIEQPRSLCGKTSSLCGME